MHWGYMIFIGLLAVAAIYTIIPDFILHRLGAGAWKRQYTPGVAITFDDGPDPEITPRILDILDRYNVKAAFFIIGEKASRYPDLVKLIHKRGHALGSHTQNHRFAWFMSPWATWQEWDKSTAILEALTGQKVAWIRPPWGTFNLSTWLWMKSRRKQAVLWDAEGHDWQARRNPEQIIARVLKNIREGSIILLHDAGGEDGAPNNTLNALEPLCQKIIAEKKLPLTALEFPRWPVVHRWAIKGWNKWERLFAKLYRVERIDSSNVFRLSRTLYKGPDLYSQTGRLLARRGDLVGEIHLDNARLWGETDIGRKGLHLLGQIRSSLPALASYVAANPKYREVEVLVGLTLINRGVNRFGFQVQEMPLTIFTRLVGILQKLILLLLAPFGKTHLKKSLPSHPQLVWISKQQLLETWLPAEKHQI